MDLRGIKGAIKKIEAIADDEECAHLLEDELHEAFIMYVAKRKDKIGRMARKVLETNKIVFDRWYG